MSCKRDYSKVATEPSVRDRHRRQDALEELKVYKPIWKTTASDLKVMKELKEALRETYAAVADKFDGWSRLSEKQVAFARAYAKNGRTNILGAMRAAGYVYNAKGNMTNEGKVLLQSEAIQELVRAFEFEEKARLMITVEDVVKWFNDIATAAMAAGDFTNANRSMENLGKYLQMFVEKKEITHRVVHNQAELDARIQELNAILEEAKPTIGEQLRVH